jgi:hypothetical protein
MKIRKIIPGFYAKASFFVFFAALAWLAPSGAAQAATYYVDPVSGNDSYSGLAGVFSSGTAGPWRSITKVNNSVSASGDRVFFKAGTTAILPASPTTGLTVDWPNATVGSYYLDSGNNPVVGTGSAGKAKISGNGGEFPTGWPGAYFRAVNVTASNATIQDLEIMEANGCGVWIEARDGLTPHNAVFQRLNIHHNRFSGLILVNIISPIVRNCDIWENVEYDARGLDVNPGEYNNWGAGLGGRGNTDLLVQNNRVWRNWGEGIGFFAKNVRVRIMDNISYDNRRPNIYYDCNASGVIARNLVFRSQNTITLTPSYGNIIVTSEYWHGDAYCDSASMDNVSIWGNTSSGGSYNFIAEPYWVMNGAKIFNNTFVEPRETPEGSTANVRIGNVAAAEFKNNIILQTAGNTAPIAVFPATGVTRSNNIWSHASASIDADARGTGDRYSVWPIQKTTGWTYTSITPNSLTGSEFSLPAGSAAIDAGTNLCPTGCAAGFEYNTLLDAGRSNLTVPVWATAVQSGTWDIGAIPFAPAPPPPASDTTPPAAPTGLSVR